MNMGDTSTEAMYRPRAPHLHVLCHRLVTVLGHQRSSKMHLARQATGTAHIPQDSPSL